jgi:hypothetical protein
VALFCSKIGIPLDISVIMDPIHSLPPEAGFMREGRILIPPPLTRPAAAIGTPDSPEVASGEDPFEPAPRFDSFWRASSHWISVHSLSDRISDDLIQGRLFLSHRPPALFIPDKALEK